LEINEIADLIRATDKKHMKIFILMLIATAARPKTVRSLISIQKAERKRLKPAQQ